MRRALWLLLVSLSPCLLVSPTPALAAGRPIQEFVADEGQWRAWAEKQLPITVEGRYSAINPRSLSMRNCDLPFRPPPGKDLPKVNRSSPNIEVVGHMVLDNNRPAFVVERIRELPSDVEEAQARARRAKRNDPEEWYALGKWAAGRGAFYKDEELIKEAHAANLRGLSIERAAVPADQPEQLFTLAVKVAELNLPETLRAEMVHEGYRRKWDRLRAEKEPKFTEFLEQLARDLPGTAIPLQPPLPRLEQKYAESPLPVYEESSAEDRRRLHRLLYAQVALASIVRAARLDGSNGAAIADELDRVLPEQHSLAESWRERELDYRLKRIDTAGRQEMLDLSEQFRKRNRLDTARQVIKTWLAKREDFLRKEGTDGLKQLADEHLGLLEDEAAAAKFLIEAHKLSPESKEIAARLEKLDYRLQEGKWVPTREFKAAPQDPIYQAMRDGRVVPGMTGTQVRKTLGPPTSSVRVASINEVNEIWTYGPKSTTRLAVHLIRSSRGETESKVTNVVQIAPR